MTPTQEFISVAGEWTWMSMHNSMGGFFHYAKEIGLAPMHLGALMKIGRVGARKVSSLGGDFGVTNAASSQMLDRLVGLGLVTRTEDPVDRRSKRVELTPLGLETVSRGMAARQDWLDRVASRMSETEIEAALGAFKALVRTARDVERERSGDR